MTKLAVLKKLEERRRNLPQMTEKLAANLLLQRKIIRASQNEIIKAQRHHVESQLSAMGAHDQKLLSLRRDQILQSLGLD